MAKYTIMNMTPEATSDCYQPGCIGVTGGVCVGALPEASNITLWWCCTPYASKCRGGQQMTCSSELTTCSSTTYTWCCNSALEECPDATGIDGSCLPEYYENPVRNGPIWGPDAVNSNNTTPVSASASASTPIFTSTSASASPVLSTSSTVSSTTTASSSITPATAGGVGAVCGGLFVLAVGCVVYFLRKRGREQGNNRAIAELDTAQMKPVEMRGECLYEIGPGGRI